MSRCEIANFASFTQRPSKYYGGQGQDAAVLQAACIASAASLSIVRRIFSENQRMYIQHMNPEKTIIFLQTGGRDTKQSSGG